MSYHPASQPATGIQTQQGYVLIATTNEIPGYRIVEYRGVVFGITVRTRGAGGQCIASCQSCVGGEITAYTEMVFEARNDAYARLAAEAASRGANAVVGVRFDSSSGGTQQAYTEVVAYGTAVVVVPEGQ